MKLFGLEITRAPRTKAAVSPVQWPSAVTNLGGWFPVIRESFAGAWQRNVELRQDTVLSFAAVYACVTLIASDIGKLRIKLVAQNADDIWEEVESPAFSPVLRKPNRYQTRIPFFEYWTASKLLHGNTYVLKQRDERNVVVALYVLDPTRVRPMVAPDGSVFYALSQDNLAQIDEAEGLMVPASEIIHDVMVTLYHPLCGVSPITACGLAALQGLNVQRHSATFFGNGARPGGVLTAPGPIGEETAKRIKEHWDANYSGENAGRVAVLGDGLKYEQMVMKSTDAQMLEQLKWTAENVCTAFHVPPYMVGVSAPPPYNNVEALTVQYYTQCLQNPIEKIELLLDEGLGLVDARTPDGRRYGTEFELDDLLRMDTASRMQAAEHAIKSGVAPNEVRRNYHGLGPVKGGETPFLQEQNWPIGHLAARPLPERPVTPPAESDTGPSEMRLAKARAKAARVFRGAA